MTFRSELSGSLSRFHMKNNLYFIMLLVESQQSDVLSAFHMQSPLLISHDWSAGLIQCIADSPPRSPGPLCHKAPAMNEYHHPETQRTDNCLPRNGLSCSLCISLLCSYIHIVDLQQGLFPVFDPFLALEK